MRSLAVVLAATGLLAAPIAQAADVRSGAALPAVSSVSPSAVARTSGSDAESSEALLAMGPIFFIAFAAVIFAIVEVISSDSQDPNTP